MTEEQLQEAATQERRKDPRPNILFIFTDQQTADALSCAGNPHVNTPWMDRLAARGVRFTRNYCAAPICGPSRSALVTGRMPHQTGVLFNGTAPDPEIPTYGTHLREQGYATHWVGKWHLPESYPMEPEIPGFHNRPLLDGMGWPSSPRGDMTDTYFAGVAYSMLRWELTKEARPWHLTVSLHNPHDICYHCMDERERPFTNLESYPPLPDSFEPSKDEPEAILACRRAPNSGQEMPYTTDWTEERWRAYLDSYYRMVQSVDDAVGLILSGLEESGMAEDTLIVFSSDHGEGLATHRWVCKNHFIEPVVKVPLIVSWPGRVPEGKLCDEITGGLDLSATFLDYAGAAELPGHGTSLKPVLDQEDSELAGYTVTSLTLYPEDQPTHGRMLVSERFKYNVFVGKQVEEQLFDLSDDPGEQRNLAENADFKENLKAHRQNLTDWCEKTQDPFKAYLEKLTY